MRFSQGFREVFARLSLQKYFRERFARAEKNQFLRAAGAPARGAAEPGPPRHAKIGKNGTQKSLHAAVIKPGTISRILESLASLKPPSVQQHLPQRRKEDNHNMIVQQVVTAPPNTFLTKYFSKFVGVYYVSQLGRHLSGSTM